MPRHTGQNGNAKTRFKRARRKYFQEYFPVSVTLVPMNSSQMSKVILG